MLFQKKNILVLNIQMERQCQAKKSLSDNLIQLAKLWYGYVLKSIS